jgi:hypothetical protein
VDFAIHAGETIAFEGRDIASLEGTDLMACRPGVGSIPLSVGDAGVLGGRAGVDLGSLRCVTRAC